MEKVPLLLQDDKLFNHVATEEDFNELLNGMDLFITLFLEDTYFWARFIMSFRLYHHRTRKMFVPEMVCFVENVDIFYSNLHHIFISGSSDRIMELILDVIFYERHKNKPSVFIAGNEDGPFQHDSYTNLFNLTIDDRPSFAAFITAMPLYSLFIGSLSVYLREWKSCVKFGISVTFSMMNDKNLTCSTVDNHRFVEKLKDRLRLLMKKLDLRTVIFRGSENAICHDFFSNFVNSVYGQNKFDIDKFLSGVILDRLKPKQRKATKLKLKLLLSTMTQATTDTMMSTDITAEYIQKLLLEPYSINDVVPLTSGLSCLIKTDCKHKQFRQPPDVYYMVFICKLKVVQGIYGDFSNASSLDRERLIETCFQVFLQSNGGTSVRHRFSVRTFQVSGNVMQLCRKLAKEKVFHHSASEEETVAITKRMLQVPANMSSVLQGGNCSVSFGQYVMPLTLKRLVLQIEHPDGATDKVRRENVSEWKSCSQPSRSNRPKLKKIPVKDTFTNKQHKPKKQQSSSKTVAKDDIKRNGDTLTETGSAPLEVVLEKVESEVDKQDDVPSTITQPLTQLKEVDTKRVCSFCGRVEPFRKAFKKCNLNLHQCKKHGVYPFAPQTLQRPVPSPLQAY